jgi:hypothetical protein
MPFIQQRPGEADFAFALRRLRVTGIATAGILIFAVAWWLAFPTVLILDRGPLIWFASVLVSFALLVFGTVFLVTTAISLLTHLWFLLERHYPKLSSPRKTVATGIETALLILALGYSSMGSTER